MTKNVKIALISIAVIIIASILTIYSQRNSTPAEKQTVKIGLITPLSGKLAFLGEPSKKAAELALKNAGNTKYNYELVFEDSQFDPKLAVTGASKLINVDKVLGIITFGSGTADAINTIAENGKTSQFALASDPTAAKGVYNYIHWTPPFKEGELLASEFIKRGYKNVAIIGTNHPGTLAVTDAVRASLTGSEVKIVSYDLTNIGEKDFRTLIIKMKDLNPDMVVMEMFSPEIEIMARQMKELGLNTEVTSVETFEWSSNPELFEGSWFISDSVVPGFTEKFKTAYNSDPAPGASYTYDLVSYLINIQEKSGRVILPADLPDVISKSGEWNSATFGKIVIDKEGFFVTEASVKMIKDGKAVVVN